MRECSRCEKPSLAYSAYCKFHELEYRRQRTAKRKAIGICLRCDAKISGSSPLCLRHQEEAKKYNTAFRRHWRIKKRKAKLCEKCGKKDPYKKGKHICIDCLEVARKRMRKKLGLNPQKRYAHEKDNP